jgi:hypothetical protein
VRSRASPAEVGWPGASQPRAPQNPYVTISRHTALVVLVISQPVSPRPSARSTSAAGQPRHQSPAWLLPGSELLVLLHGPPQQVGADAAEQGIQRRAKEAPVIVHPATVLRRCISGHTGRLPGFTRSEIDQHGVVTPQVLHQGACPETASVRPAATTSNTPPGGVLQKLSVELPVPRHATGWGPPENLGPPG